ncbi:hypothetical protein SAMN05216489_00283 [Streptomyces sp. 3213]|nr:hypothetical protein SAMN05216489_00283 [Streptomyces sp. 3213] [Streptomyces sp. 3213.3]
MVSQLVPQTRSAITAAARNESCTEAQIRAAWRT